MELSIFFPTQFPKNGNKEQTNLRYQRADTLLSQVIEGDKDFEKEIFDIEKQILESDTPNVWNTYEEDNMEREIEVGFYKYAHNVLENSNLDLENMTTFKFYTKVEQIIEKNTPKT